MKTKLKKLKLPILQKLARGKRERRRNGVGAQRLGLLVASLVQFTTSRAKQNTCKRLEERELAQSFLVLKLLFGLRIEFKNICV